MKKRITIIVFIFVLLSVGISTILHTSPAQREAASEKIFARYQNLASDGLMHEPYGWDNLYGSKEVPAIWWDRNPHDVIAGEKTDIHIAVSKNLEQMDIQIEWVKNGKRMPPIQCTPRANLKANGVDKIQYMGTLDDLEVGDQIVYGICALENNKAQKFLGTYAFSVSSWEPLTIQGAVDENDGFTVCAAAGKLPVNLQIALQEENVLSLTVANGSAKGQEAFPQSLRNGSQRVVFEEDGSFSLQNGTDTPIRCAGIEVLTDGVTASAVRLTVDANAEDRFYGFGMKYDDLDQRGKTVDTYCVNWYTNQDGETYTPVPYYFVPDRYGLFVDSTYYSQFSMCDAVEDACVITVNTGGEEAFHVPIYFMMGTNTDISASYATLAGHAELPPVWAFGPWLSANEWDKQSEIMEQLTQTLDNQIATTVIVIEAWSDEQTFYAFNDARFTPTDSNEPLQYQDYTFTGKWPDPKKMVDQLHENDIRCILWQIPVLKYDAQASAQSVKDQNYATEQGYVLQYEDGRTYRLPSGTWFGNSLLVDFTNREAVDWFLEKRRYLIEDIGVDGFKTDGGEFVWGRNIVASDGTKGLELRNAYPDLYAKAYYDFANEIVEGAVTFSRAGGSSMQTHPLCWVGDQTSEFKSFQSAIKASLSASMSGIPFVAWDIAGFSGDVPTAELYQRSVAQAAFSAIMQVHSESSGDPAPSRARTPWNMAIRKKDSACLETYRYYANLRMNLLPYIYTEARYASAQGIPLMQSMAYAFANDNLAREYEYQYMLGRNMLVAPVTTTNAKQVEVYLPEGKWYSLFDGTYYAGGKVYSVPCAVDEIPVFVKEGTVLPMNSDATGAMGTYVGNSTDAYHTLTYYVYPGKSEYVWYDYVSEREVTLVNDGVSVTADGLPVQQAHRMEGIN